MKALNAKDKALSVSPWGGWEAHGKSRRQGVGVDSDLVLFMCLSLPPIVF